MKNPVLKICLLIFTLFVPALTNAQHLKVGFGTGVNYSDIHGNKEAGKWSHNPGPTQEINIDYSLNRIFSVETGIDFTTLYYEYLPYYYKSNPAYGTDYSYASSSCSFCLPPPYFPSYYYFGDKMDFNYIRIPLSFRITFPSKPVFDVSAGYYLSVLRDYSLRLPDDDNADKYDSGLKLSAGLSYPLTGNLSAVVKGNYFSGKRTFLRDLTLRHGASELLFGMSWSAFNGKSGKAAQKDSLSVDENLKLLYSGGLNISLNNIKFPGKSYLPGYGFSAGFLFDYQWNPRSSLRTGLSIERTGYSMRDSSDMFYRYGGEGKMNYFIKTSVSIDYLDLPLLLTFYSGRSNGIYFGFGPYFGWKLNARCTGKAYSISRSGSSYTEILTTVFDDMERLIKGMDVGYIVFGGITIPLGNNYFLDAGLRYRHGSKNVFKGSAEQTYTDSDFKKILNETFTVQTALKVPLFKRVK